MLTNSKLEHVPGGKLGIPAPKRAITDEPSGSEQEKKTPEKREPPKTVEEFMGQYGNQWLEVGRFETSRETAQLLTMLQPLIDIDPEYNRAYLDEAKRKLKSITLEEQVESGAREEAVKLRNIAYSLSQVKVLRVMVSSKQWFSSDWDQNRAEKYSAMLLEGLEKVRLGLISQLSKLDKFKKLPKLPRKVKILPNQVVVETRGRWGVFSERRLLATIDSAMLNEPSPATEFFIKAFVGSLYVFIPYYAFFSWENSKIKSLFWGSVSVWMYWDLIEKAIDDPTTLLDLIPFGVVSVPVAIVLAILLRSSRGGYIEEKEEIYDWQRNTTMPSDDDDKAMVSRPFYEVVPMKSRGVDTFRIVNRGTEVRSVAAHKRAVESLIGLLNYDGQFNENYDAVRKRLAMQAARALRNMASGDPKVLTKIGIAGLESQWPSVIKWALKMLEQSGTKRAKSALKKEYERLLYATSAAVPLSLLDQMQESLMRLSEKVLRNENQENQWRVVSRSVDDVTESFGPIDAEKIDDLTRWVKNASGVRKDEEPGRDPDKLVEKAVKLARRHRLIWHTGKITLRTRGLARRDGKAKDAPEEFILTSVKIEMRDDSAMLTEAGQDVADEAKVGGIDLNEISVERQGGGIDVKFTPATVDPILQKGITGFAPVIINLTPINSVLPLLGLEPRREKEEYEVSSLNK